MGEYDEVEVFVPYDRHWVAGFELADVVQSDDGDSLFRLRRRSDGTLLPVAMPADRVRPAHSVRW